MKFLFFGTGADGFRDIKNVRGLLITPPPPPGGSCVFVCFCWDGNDFLFGGGLW